MTVQSIVTRPTGATPPRLFRELEHVRLLRDFQSPAGVVPKGTLATVLQVFAHGQAYQVEFEGPFEVPETVPASLLHGNGQAT